MLGLGETVISPGECRYCGTEEVRSGDAGAGGERYYDWLVEHGGS